MSIKETLAGGFAAVVLAAGLAAMPQPASASTDGMPDGSWRQSCERAYVERGTLHAQCRRASGQYVVATAQIGSCQAFGNRDGTLVCESYAGGNGTVGQWTGSFRDSCRDVSVDKHGKLRATCRKDNGTYKSTNLQAQKCPSRRAGNRDGNLFCESDDGYGQYVGQWSGSFSKSCRDASVDSNGTLTATCQAANGSWRRTSLASRQCSSHRAGNRDGNLFCESAAAGSENTSSWDGSFRNSCRNISVNSQGWLTADCQAANGQWRRTSLAPIQCRGRHAGNRDGTLVCESATTGSASPSRWDGSFSQSCRDVSVDSNGTLTATCQAANGSWRRTSLSSRQCGSYRAGNRDGTLFCEK